MSHLRLFDGSDYEPAHDDLRLLNQFDRIKEVMSDSQWRTLEEISRVTGDSTASISAQLRHFRKEKHGSYIVEKRNRGHRKHGLFEYRMLPPCKETEDSLMAVVKEKYENYKRQKAILAKARLSVKRAIKRLKDFRSARSTGGYYA